MFIETLGEQVEVRRGDGGVKVMFHVEKHVVGKAVDPCAALSAARWIWGVVMDDPNGEESGEAFAKQHCGGVPMPRGTGAKRNANKNHGQC